MKTICLKPWELAAYMRHKKLLVVRPVKPQPDKDWIPIACEEYRPAVVDRHGMITEAKKSVFGAYDEDWGIDCPFGKPGEVLGIKEPWAPYSALDESTVDVIYRSLYDEKAFGSGQAQGATKRFTVPFEIANDFKSRVERFEVLGQKWRPAHHLPLWAIRHRPTIADIRVMRVQDITDDEARQAGMTDGENLKECPDCRGHGAVGSCLSDMRECRFRCSTASGAFKAMWNKHYPTLSWGWGIFLEGT